jgi:predicted membrane protein
MNNYTKPRNDGSIAFGVIILGIGLVLLFRKFGLYIPDWVLTWPMILIAIGTYTLISQQFKSFFGSVVLFIGVYFLLKREFDLDLGLDQFIWPVGLIALGIYLILHKKQEYKVMEEARKNWESSRKKKEAPEDLAVVETENAVEEMPRKAGTPPGDPGFTRASSTSFSDHIQVQSILSGVNRKIVTKNFQGGNLLVMFGSADLDLTQADFTGVATLQLDILMGEAKLLVPSHWDIRIEVTNIAAGLKDKRKFREGAIDSTKVLVLKGTIAFGGLEIKSF